MELFNYNQDILKYIWNANIISTKKDNKYNDLIKSAYIIYEESLWIVT